MMRPGRASERGLTLVELMVSLAMMAILLGTVVRYVFSTQQGLLKQEAGAELLNRSGRINANLRASLGGSRLLVADYGGSPDLGHYRAWVRDSILGSPSTAQPAPFVLPAVVTNARAANLSPSAAIDRLHWGNELLFVATLQPLTLSVQIGTGPSATAQALSLDRIQFVYIYPSLVATRTGGQALRLAEWRSQPYLLYDSISDMSGAKLTRTCEALVARGYEWALDLDMIAQPDQAWYKVDDVDPLIQQDEDGPTGAPQAQWGYLDDFDYVANFHPRPGANLGQVKRAGGDVQSGRANFVLAFNTVDPSVEPQWRSPQLLGPGKEYKVPAYALAGKSSVPSFPGGFEVAILGRPQARELHIRHVLVAIAATDPRAGGARRAQEGLITVAVKNDY